MKKLTVLLFAIVLGFGQIFASNYNPNNSKEKELKNEITALLKSPKIEIEQIEIIADIQFTINTKSEIVVLSVDSDKDLVVSYVKSRLNYKKVTIKDGRSINRVFNVKLRIKNPKNV